MAEIASKETDRSEKQTQLERKRNRRRKALEEIFAAGDEAGDSQNSDADQVPGLGELRNAFDEKCEHFRSRKELLENERIRLRRDLDRLKNQTTLLQSDLEAKERKVAETENSFKEVSGGCSIVTWI